MLIGGAGRQRHSDDISEYACPEGVDKLRIVIDEHDHFTAGPRTAGLKMMQQSQCPGVEFTERQLAPVVFAFEVVDGALA